MPDRIRLHGPRWAPAVAGALAVCALLAAAGSAANGASDSLRVAVLVPANGYFAAHNKLIAEGAEIAAAESGKPGLVGPLKIDLVRLRIPTHPNAHRVVAALAKRGVGVVVLPCDVDSAPALARAASARNLLVLSPCTPDPGVTLQIRHVWPTAMLGNEFAAVAVAYARNNNATTGYVLTSGATAYTRTMSRYFREAAKLDGMKILGVGTVSLAHPNVAGVVRALKKKQPRVILTPIFSPYLQPVLAKLRAKGLLQPVYATEGLDAEQLLSRYAKPLDEVYYGTFGFPRSTSRTFRSDYESTFHKQLKGSFPGLGYETIRILSAAAENADSSNPMAIESAFEHGFKVKGVALGDVVYHGKGNKNPSASVGLSRILYGDDVILSAMDPEHTVRIPAP
jgi:branched-chain amino acid transport system substrate-binding protein